MSAFWTSHIVNEHLVQAFRSFPSHVVYSAARTFRSYEDPQTGAHPATADAFSWAPRFLATYPRAQLQLYTWARCRAQRLSWRAYCIEKGWPHSTAEKSRALAASVIADGLNEEALRAATPAPCL